jgi:hypothetical protein
MLIVIKVFFSSTLGTIANSFLTNLALFQLHLQTMLCCNHSILASKICVVDKVLPIRTLVGWEIDFGAWHRSSYTLSNGLGRYGIDSLR